MADLKDLAKAAAAEAVKDADPATIARRKRWAVGAGVVVAGLGFLFVWSLISKIGAYLLMLVFGGAVAAGAWYLLRGKVQKSLEARATAKATAKAEVDAKTAAEDKQRKLEAQLAELKRKAR
ncbi:MAG: hypothetical protein KC933_24755 [Myxococcales bacterium]|nr:hypothetical protein [Myxococcales bacterium]MCB9648032.1 hypothetical protein [Deltaproteobacteria bacterium]